MSNMLQRVIPPLLGAWFLVAASMKVASAERFLLVVVRILKLSGETVLIELAAASLLVGWEAALGVALMFSGHHRRVRYAAGCTIAALSLVPLALIVTGSRVSCGCFGFGGTGSHDAWIGLIRNACAICMIVWLGPSGTSRSGKEPQRAGSESSELAPRARAFSLIELLVVIAIVATVIALTLATLAAQRSRAAVVSSLAMQSQIARVVTAYANDHRSMFPYFHTEGDPSSPAIIEGVAASRTSYFSSGVHLWPNALGESYFGGYPAWLVEDPERCAEMNVLDGYPSQWIRSKVKLTATIFATPEFWASDDAPVRNEMFRAQSADSVVFPSGKGLTVDSSQAVFGRGRPVPGRACVGFVDGSAQQIVWDWQPSQAVSRPFGASQTPWLVITTTDGLRGRDR